MKSVSGWVMLAAAVGMVLIGMAIAGCSLDTLIQVKTPGVVKQTHGYAGQMSLRDSRDAFETWSAEVMIVRDQWIENITDGENLRGTLQAFGNDALAQITPALGGMPFGTIGASLLTLGAGVFFGKKSVESKWRAADAAWDEASAQAKAPGQQISGAADPQG